MDAAFREYSHTAFIGECDSIPLRFLSNFSLRVCTWKGFEGFLWSQNLLSSLRHELGFQNRKLSAIEFDLFSGSLPAHARIELKRVEDFAACGVATTVVRRIGEGGRGRREGRSVMIMEPRNKRECGWCSS